MAEDTAITPAQDEDLEDFLTRLRASLEQRREQLQAHRAHLIRQRELADINLRKLDNAIRGLNDAPSSPPRKAEKEIQTILPLRPDNTGFGISLQAAKEAADGIKRFVSTRRTGKDKTFSQKEIYEFIGWDQGQMSNAFRYLRQIEFLRKAGMNGRREAWAILDADAVDRDIEKAKKAIEDHRQMLCNGSLDSDDPLERMTAFLRDHGQVVGWGGALEAARLTKGQESTVRHRLLSLGLIKVTKQPGRRSIIEWIGDTNATVDKRS